MRTLGVTFMTTVLLVSSTIGVVGQSDPTSRPPVPSAGCEISLVEPGTYRAEELTILDAQKKWAMHVPAAHSGSGPLPLWIDLHGVGGSGSGQILELKRSSEEHGFVLAAPTESLGKAGWMWREEDPELDLSLSNPDVTFIVTLLDHLDAHLCVDLARIYVAGYSGGGEGASVLGCVLEDRIAAVAPVAGMLDPGAACQLDRPVPLLAVHGTADRSNYFDGGLAPGYNEFPVVQALAQTSIPDRVTNAALRNGCEPEPPVVALADAMERWTWICAPGAEVELLVHGGGHSRPANTIESIWEFFERYSLPA